METLLLDLAIKRNMTVEQKDMILEILDCPDWKDRLALYLVADLVLGNVLSPEDLGIETDE